MVHPLKWILSQWLWRTRLLAFIGLLRRWLHGPRLIVLCYHRIHNDPGLAALSADPKSFALQLDWLSRHFDVLPIKNVARYLNGDYRLTRDGIALTFDDGYLDNFQTAFPLLKSKNLAAAFFISTDPLLNRMPYWYDVLWTRLKEWNGGDLSPHSDQAIPTALKAALDAAQRNTNKASLQGVLDASKGLSKKNRDQLIKALKKRNDSDSINDDCETMSIAQAKTVLAYGIDIGGHSQSHPSLARIGEGECRREISESLKQLKNAGFAPRYFAYPFGESEDVGGPLGIPRKILAEMNIDLAFTTEERAVRQQEDRLLVPRKVISPQSLPQIALKLELLSWRK